VTDKNTITISEVDLLASVDDNETITLSNWDSPLSTTLSTSMCPSATLGAAGIPTSSLPMNAYSPSITTSSTGTMARNNTIATSANPYTVNITPSIMKVECDAEFHGEVKIRGVKLDERLNTIEERLGILRPNHDLEGKWEKLKELGEQYRQLEKEILEKEQVWDLLKK
jgi:hypothetical protein